MKNAAFQPNETTLVTILLVPESSMMTLSSVIDPLRAANRLSRQPLFKWRITSASGDSVKLSCGIDIAVDAKFQAAEKGDLLFVIAGFNHANHIKGTTLSLLKTASKHFKIVAAIEAGSWLLARANVITTHTVTTHWEDLESFAFSFPRLHVVEQRYVIDGNIWTSGGASPALDMLLHYLRSTHRQSLALDVANVFIYNETSSSSDFQDIVPASRLKALEPRLAAAIQLMERNIEEPLSISQIAAEVKLSTRMLEIICQRHLEITPKAYYLRLRLQSARRQVLDTTNSLLDISVRCGFNSQANFCRAFKSRYGQSPISLRGSNLANELIARASS